MKGNPGRPYRAAGELSANRNSYHRQLIRIPSRRCPSARAESLRCLTRAGLPGVLQKRPHIIITKLWEFLIEKADRTKVARRKRAELRQLLSASEG